MAFSSSQSFYGHGKVLLSGEYAVLYGAKAFGIPLKLGQSLELSYYHTFDPYLHWKSFDINGELWFEGRFELWHFDSLDKEKRDHPLTLKLQKILRGARAQNSHFLRDNTGVSVETHLEFPLDWGLGSSSTLVYNIAQWAYVSPFDLQFSCLGGSGFDIACAQSEGPIVYEYIRGEVPSWRSEEFYPPFEDKLYFVHLGRKANTSEALEKLEKKIPNDKLIGEISAISELLLHASNLREFQNGIREHEYLIAAFLGHETVKESLFSDFPGEIKSLGAWGGDFALVAADLAPVEVYRYFSERGKKVIIPFSDLILRGSSYDSESRLLGREERIHMVMANSRLKGPLRIEDSF